MSTQLITVLRHAVLAGVDPDELLTQWDLLRAQTIYVQKSYVEHAPLYTDCLTAIASIIEELGQEYAQCQLFTQIEPLDRIGNMPKKLVERGWEVFTIPANKMQPGDLVFFGDRQVVHLNSDKNGATRAKHVGMAVSNTEIFHSSAEHKGARMELITDMFLRYAPFTDAAILLKSVDLRNKFIAKFGKAPPKNSILVSPESTTTSGAGAKRASPLSGATTSPNIADSHPSSPREIPDHTNTPMRAISASSYFRTPHSPELTQIVITPEPQNRALTKHLIMQGTRSAFTTPSPTNGLSNSPLPRSSSQHFSETYSPVPASHSPFSAASSAASSMDVSLVNSNAHTPERGPRLAPQSETSSLASRMEFISLGIGFGGGVDGLAASFSATPSAVHTTNN